MKPFFDVLDSVRDLLQKKLLTFYFQFLVQYVLAVRW